MKPERTLQQMLDDWPSLHKDRWAAMDHLFLIIGNGYEWHDGELISDNEYYEYDHINECNIVSSIYEPHSDGPDIKKAIQTKRTAEHEFNNELIISALNRRLRELNRLEINPDIRIWSYDPSLNKYEAIFNIPDDVTKEWSMLIKEFKNALKEDGIDIDTGNITEEGVKHLRKTYQL